MFDPAVTPQLGEYELLEPLGAGGQSTVYKARHRLMNRLVALKILHDDHLQVEERTRLFRIEIEVSGMLIHPNILRAYDAREYEGIPYLVMELRTGTDLAQVIKDRGTLSAPDAIRCIRQSALGLAFAHERGVVHRDVKPSNLFFSDDASVLVFDWGLATLRAASAARPGSTPARRPDPPTVSRPGAETPRDRKPDDPGPAPPAAGAAPRPDTMEAGMVGGRIPGRHTMAAADMSSEDPPPELTRSAPKERELASLWQHDVDAAGAATATHFFAVERAAVPQTLSWAGHIVGTPAFMAPEQARYGEVDQRADIYSLGATLFCLLTGRPMYTGQIKDVLYAHRDDPIPPLAEHCIDPPANLDAVYRRMVAKAPADRYQSMADVITALDLLSARSRIFISYRREDSIDATDRMFERLAAHFGHENVFMDFDTIPPGTDFRLRLQQAVDQAGLVLAVIGDHWLTASTRSFWWRKRRLDDPNDFVRIEIEAALARGITVVPVLVGQARMPAPSELPHSLRNLAFQQAAELRPGRQYHEQIDVLIVTIRQHLAKPEG
jgi:serine/threonine protein kinase